jgi:hypothetical protein
LTYTIFVFYKLIQLTRHNYHCTLQNRNQDRFGFVPKKRRKQMKHSYRALFASALFLLAAASPAMAQTYEGDWEFEKPDGEREKVYLGDDSGEMLYLRGTTWYCGAPGDSYSYVRSVLLNNGQDGQKITWWFDETCTKGYVRVCVQNRMGQTACSTYINKGWVPKNN